MMISVVSLVSFVYWHINFHGLFNAKAILAEEQQEYYLIHSWGNKGVHAFPKGISPKVIIIVWLEFKITYFKVAVQ